MTAIKKLVDAFTSDLEKLVREEALGSIRAALLAAVTTVPAPTARKASVSRPAEKKASRRTPTVVSKSTPKRVRRNSRLIEREADRIYLAVRAKPGSSSEQLRAATKLPRASMPLPVKLLLEQNRIRKTGAKRATKYFPA